MSTRHAHTQNKLSLFIVTPLDSRQCLQPQSLIKRSDNRHGGPFGERHPFVFGSAQFTHSFAWICGTQLRCTYSPPCNMAVNERHQLMSLMKLKFEYLCRSLRVVWISCGDKQLPLFIQAKIKILICGKIRLCA